MSIRGRVAAQNRIARLERIERLKNPGPTKEDRMAASVADQAVHPRSVAPCHRLDNAVVDAGAIERARISRHERRALLKHSGGAYTSEQWQELLSRSGGRCLRCGSDEDITVDHVKPVHLGGSNDIGNIQPLCRSCNSWKGTKTVDFR